MQRTLICIHRVFQSKTACYHLHIMSFWNNQMSEPQRNKSPLVFSFMINKGEKMQMFLCSL